MDMSDFLYCLEQGQPEINLAFGYPQDQPSDALKVAAIESIENGNNGYSHPGGIPKLRRMLSEEWCEAAKVHSSPPIICSGVSAGIALALFSIFDHTKGELITIEPTFPQHQILARYSKAVVRSVRSGPTDFRLPIDAIANAINSLTKAILICSPNNPTGVIYSNSELNELVRLARDSGIWIIADEIYHDIVLDERGECAPSVLGEYDKAIVVRGFSKSHSVPGWRIGYVFAPPSIERDIVALNQVLYSCAPTPFQHAFLSIDSLRIDCSMRLDLRAKAIGAVKILRDVMDVRCPQGGVFLFFPVPSSTNSVEFFKRGLEDGVGIMPGCLFGGYSNFARLSFIGEADELFEGCNRLVRVAAELS